MWTANGAPVGGLMTLAEEAKQMGAPPNWLPYISVGDVDAAAQKAVTLGAKIHVGPHEVPGAGRFCILADPQGATLAMYRAATPMPAGSGEPKAGEFSWHELATTDGRKAWEFYSAVFGWQKTSEMDMGSAGVYQMFGTGGPPLGGVYTKDASLPAPRWLSYVHVANVDKAIPRITGGGGAIVSGPMDVPGGDRIVQFRDPQGAVFALHAKSAAAPAARVAERPKAKSTGASASRVKPKARVKPKKTKTKAPKAKARVKRSAPRSKPKKKAASRSRNKAQSRRPARKAAKRRKTVRRRAASKRRR